MYAAKFTFNEVNGVKRWKCVGCWGNAYHTKPVVLNYSYYDGYWCPLKNKELLVRVNRKVKPGFSKRPDFYI